MRRSSKVVKLFEDRFRNLKDAHCSAISLIEIKPQCERFKMSRYFWCCLGSRVRRDGWTEWDKSKPLRR